MRRKASLRRAGERILRGMRETYRRRLDGIAPRFASSPARKPGPTVTMQVRFDFWACQRPLTHTWGSGQVFERLSRNFGTPDVAFGKTDGIPEGVRSIDRKNGYEWAKLPFEDNKFDFGYWDPPSGGDSAKRVPVDSPPPPER